MPELLKLENVTAGYDETVVLENVSLAMQHDESVGVIGRNGVGKTTLLETVMGLTTLISGRLVFAEREITRLGPDDRSRLGVGFVPQEREIFPSLTVEENVRVAARPGEWTLDRVFDLFPRLHQRRRNYGNQLSGGEQQMLAVARALVGNPKLILLDEPFEGLAPLIIELIMEALVRLRRESRVAVLLVEQHVELALELVGRAVVLDRGQIVWEGASSDLAGDRERLGVLIGLQESVLADAPGA